MNSNILIFFSRSVRHGAHGDNVVLIGIVKKRYWCILNISIFQPFPIKKARLKIQSFCFISNSPTTLFLLSVAYKPMIIKENECIISKNTPQDTGHIAIIQKFYEISLELLIACNCFLLELELYCESWISWNWRYEIISNATLRIIWPLC